MTLDILEPPTSAVPPLDYHTDNEQSEDEDANEPHIERIVVPSKIRIARVPPATDSRSAVPPNSSAHRMVGRNAPLPIADMRRTQRRLAALLNKKSNVIQPKSPRKHLPKPRVHFCMCSRLDPDGKYRDPALNFLRDGLRNVGLNFPDFCYTERVRRFPRSEPTTARSDAIITGTDRDNILTSPFKDAYTGKPLQDVLSPDDIANFDYRKLKSLIVRRDKLPLISENQMIATRGGGVAPENTPCATADARKRVQFPPLGETYDRISEEGSRAENYKDKIDEALQKNDQAKKENIDKQKEAVESRDVENENGLKRGKTDGDDKPRKEVKDKTNSSKDDKMASDGVAATPFGGAIQTKAVREVKQIPQKKPKKPKILGKNRQMIQALPELPTVTEPPKVSRQSSGYGTEPPPEPKKLSAMSRKPGSFLQNELSVVGSREATMMSSAQPSFVRTQATRDSSMFDSEGSYSFFRGREDTASASLQMAYSPSNGSRFQGLSPSDFSFVESARDILQHQYHEPTPDSQATPVDVFEKLENLNQKFESGMFDFDTDIDINRVNTTLRFDKTPSEIELPVSESVPPPVSDSPAESLKHHKRADSLPLFPNGNREAYVKALAIAAARHRMPKEAWMFGQNISRAFVFSYFDNVVPAYVCKECHKPVPTLNIKKEMKHIFKDVEVDDYYPGGKRNPLPRVDWHSHRKKGKKKK